MKLQSSYIKILINGEDNLSLNVVFNNLTYILTIYITLNYSIVLIPEIVSLFLQVLTERVMFELITREASPVRATIAIKLMMLVTLFIFSKLFYR